MVLTYSLRQKQLGHFNQMLSFPFSCSLRPSQSCLLRFGHQFLYTNIEGTRRPQSVPTILTETVLQVDFHVDFLIHHHGALGDKWQFGTNLNCSHFKLNFIFDLQHFNVLTVSNSFTSFQPMECSIFFLNWYPVTLFHGQIIPSQIILLLDFFVSLSTIQ